jgi:hypothetical protein
MAAASEGFALPQVRLLSEGQRTLVSWETSDLPSRRIRFLTRGSVYVPREHLEDTLRAFVQTVVDRLSDQGVAGTLLQDEWRSILTMDADEQKFGSAAGRLGCDPYDLSDEEAERIIAATSGLTPVLAEEFLPAVDLDSLQSQVSILRDTIQKAASIDTALLRLVELRSEGLELAADQTPWDQGYLAARALRQRLGMDGAVVRSVADLGKALGVNDREWAVAAESTRAELWVDAVVAVTRSGSPTFVVRRHSDAARAFALCRAVLEYLGSPLEPAAVVTASHSERQKRNRAFAAEFLAPADVLRQRVVGPVVAEEDIQEMADELGVSSYVIRHQIENHRLARIEQSW